MRIGNTEVNFRQFIFLIIYYLFARYLPNSTFFIFGKISKYFRYLCCKNIFSKCGYNVNIERNAYFGTGVDLEIGNNSGIGENCFVPSNIKIGNDVMMGRDCYIVDVNHNFDRIDIPIRLQGSSVKKITII
ncbi:MAG: acyltransferase, partial [Tissierellia bacterium]|nr:acyltransferase [Tissierellia bacterium]